MDFDSGKCNILSVGSSNPSHAQLAPLTFLGMSHDQGSTCTTQINQLLSTHMTVYQSKGCWGLCCFYSNSGLVATPMEGRMGCGDNQGLRQKVCIYSKPKTHSQLGIQTMMVAPSSNCRSKMPSMATAFGLQSTLAEAAPHAGVQTCLNSGVWSLSFQKYNITIILL